MNDPTLLEQYVATRSSEAFAALVRRHVDLVYAAALRRTRDPHLADDVTQATFLLLSQKAPRLKANIVLTGWLYNAARYTASTAMRSQQRRERHEQSAGRLRAENAGPSGSWEAISPHLDAAMDRLGEKDRQLVLLRYFEHRRQDEVCQMLGISEAAATKRLSRAIEKLRKHLSSHGIWTPTPALVAAIAERAVHPAPQNVAASAGGPGASVAIKAIAAGVSALRWTASLKIAAGILIAIGLVAGAVATSAVVHKRAQSGTYIIIAAWEVVGDPQFTAGIRQMSTAVASNSVGYETRIVDTDQLLRTVAASRGDKQRVYHLKGNLNFFDQRQMLGWKDGFPFTWDGFGTFRDGQRWVPYFNTIVGQLKLDGRKDNVRLSIVSTNHADTHLRVAKITPAAIKFDGDVPAGKSLLILGHIGQENGFDPTVIMVWQTVPTTLEQLPYVTAETQMARWLDRGSMGILRDAQDAVAWQNGATSPDHPQPKWTQTLDGGTTVKLVAVTNDPRGYAWWTGDGVPVALGAEWMHEAGDFAVIDIANPLDQGRHEGMSGSLGGASGSMTFHDLGDRQRVCLSTPTIDHVRIQLGTGPWKPIGDASIAQPFTANGVTCSIQQAEPIFSKAQNRTGQALLKFSHNWATDAELNFAAVDKAGRELPIAPTPDVRVVQLAKSSEAEHEQTYIAMEASDFDHVAIKTRPLKWVQFDGIATSVRQAVGQSPKPAPLAFQPTEGSPEAMMWSLADAIERRDIAGAKAPIDATDPAAAEYMRWMFAQALACSQLTQALKQRFGAAEVARVRQAGSLPLPDLSAMRNVRWKIEGDTANPIDSGNTHFTGPGLRRIHGAWKYSMMAPSTANADELQKAEKEAQRQVEVLTSLAREVDAGKFADIDGVKDAFAARAQPTTERSHR